MPEVRVVLQWLFLLAALGEHVRVAHAQKSDGAALQRISLPRGPGSVEGLGESAVSDLVSGAAKYSLQILVPSAANEHIPKLSLSYDSGAGNGPFGLGWTLSGEAVQRQTDKGMPAYSERDTFIFGGEELVRLVDGSYLAENGADFSRFVRDGEGWRQLLQSGTAVTYGITSQTTERRKGGTGFEDVFKWLKSSSSDVHGNRLEYDYRELPDSAGTKLLVGIRYGFKSWPSPNYHEISFEYEQSGTVVTSYCSSFERSLSHRCRAVTVSTVVNSVSRIIRRYVLTYAPGRRTLLESITQSDGDGNGLPPLRFTYSSSSLDFSARPAIVQVSLQRGLSTNDIALCDLNRDGLPDLCVSVPEREWEYYLNQGGLSFAEPRALSGITAAHSLRDTGTQLMDITGDGVVDLLTSPPSDQDTQSVAYYEFGLSKDLHTPFRSPKVCDKKVFTNLCSSDLFGAGVRIFDVNFDKSIDVTRILDDSLIVALNQDAGDSTRKWEERRVRFAESHFPFDTLGPTVQLADLNGDRLMDCIDVFDRDGLVKLTFYPGRGDGRFGEGLPLTFAGESGASQYGEYVTSNLQSFHFADVNSDGLSDFLHIAPGNVRVWTSWGRGFESPHDMSAPVYRTSAQVLLADVNANGSTDVLWLDPSADEQVQVLDCFPQGRGNLLSNISNGIGKVTSLHYRPLNDYYLSHIASSNPWPSGCPLPTHVVSEMSVTNSLDLDSDGALDFERTTFIYQNPYYDGFERQFRGFAFVTEICWGTPDGSSSGTATRVRRLHFHTGGDDGYDNDGNQKADLADFNPVSGREEEPLKGKLLWEETCAISAVQINEDATAIDLRDRGIDDEADNDGDGQVDEADEVHFCADRHVYRRQLNDWTVRRLFSNDSAPALFPHKTVETLRLVRDAVRLADHVLHVEGPNVQSLPSADRTTWSPRHVKRAFEYDELGRLTKTTEFGTIKPVEKTDSPREQITEYAGGTPVSGDWILDRVAVSMTSSSDGEVVFGERYYYGDTPHSFQHLPLRSVGSRALKIKTERLLTASSQEGIELANLGGANWIQGAVQKYDEFGNVETLLDGLGLPLNPTAGHSRSMQYDSYFHVYPISESIQVGPQLVLRADASYDVALGVLTACTDFELTQTGAVQDSVAGTPSGPLRQVTGNVTKWKYDSHGRLVSLIRPGDDDAFPTEVYQYIACDPVKRRKFVYDASGKVTITTVDGNWEVDLGDGNGQFQSEVGLSAVITEKRETAGQGGTVGSAKMTDGYNRTLSVVSENDNTDFLFSERTHFDDRGNPQFVSQPHVSQVLKTQSTADGDQARRDPLGRVISIRHPADQNGIVAATRSVFLPLVERVYDEEGNRVGGSHEGTFKDLEKDGFDRLSAVHQNVKLKDDGSPSVELATWTTSYGYDRSNNLVLIRDAQNNTIYHDYDSLNRRRRIRDPDRGELLFGYDDADNLQTTRDARGATIVRTYDGANRKITETGDFGNYHDVIRFHFDVPAPGVIGNGVPFVSANCRGRLAWAEDTSGASHFNYDSRGQVDEVLKLVGNKTYTCVEKFDSLQRLVQQEIAGRGTKRRYGPRGLMTSVTDLVDAELISFARHPNGTIHKETADNGVVTERLLDHRLRNKSLSIRNQHQTDYIALNYSYDQASNLVLLEDSRPLALLPAGDPRRDTVIMKYDDARRLSEESYNIGLNSDLLTVATKYDRLGNVLRKDATVNLTNTPGAELGLGDRQYAIRSGRDGVAAPAPGPHATIATLDGAPIQFDPDGSMVLLNGASLERDAWGHIRRVLVGGVVKSESTYDYEARRVRFREGAADRYSPFPQFDENPDGTIDYYVTDRDRKLFGFHAAGKRYYHHNHLNSTILVTSAAGAAKEEIAYYCGGKIRNHWSIDASRSRYTYCNKEFESAAKLYDFGSRHLTSELGIFTRCDPLLPDYNSRFLIDPLSLNPYVYAAHNSNRYVDPDGKIPIETVVDVGFVLLDIGKLAYGYYHDNAALVAEAKVDLAGDTLAAVVPYLVAGATRISRGAVHAVDGVSNSSKIADVGLGIEKGSSSGINASRGMGNIGNHNPVDADTLLSSAEKWLGSGYKQLDSGVYRSADGTRQFRMTDADLLPTHGKLGPHVHFEAINGLGKVIENLHVPVKQ